MPIHNSHFVNAKHMSTYVVSPMFMKTRNGSSRRLCYRMRKSYLYEDTRKGMGIRMFLGKAVE